MWCTPPPPKQTQEEIVIVSYKSVDICQSKHTILKACDLEVNEGELLYIVGTVGSGKTSLLRTIYGDLKPTAGKAEVLGMDMMTLRQSQLPSLRRKIGMDFQDFHFLADRTVGENLDFVLRATGWKNAAERRCRIIEVLEQVGLPEKINHHTYELSGGQKQQVSIARALLNSPKLVLADEPTCNLDAKNGETIIQLLNSLRENGTAVIITTHNTAWPEQFPGTVYRCQDGELNKE